MPSTCISGFCKEIGLVPLYYATRDVKLLCIQRFTRMMAVGASTLILATYLSVSGHAEKYIGIFMTSTIMGDVLISFLLALFADRIGRRLVLAIGSLSMAASGIVFGLTSNYWALLIAAVVGVISAGGSEVGVFRAVESSMLAHLIDTKHRGEIYAWYALSGSAGSAVGMVSCGWILDALQSHGWSSLGAYRAIYFGYSSLGLGKLCLTCCLSSSVELEKPTKKPADNENAPLLGSQSSPEPTEQASKSRRGLLPKISAETRVTALVLCILFAMDSFASGLAPLSWITYFFENKFNLYHGQLGTLFFTTSMIAALSQLLASSIAKRIGNVNTMVLAHMPSSIALALIPLPRTLPPAMSLLVLRACTQSMDNAPRSAFLADILLPSERTAILGLFNVVSMLAQSAGPTITGVFVSRDLFWVSFVAAGSIKALYDVGMVTTYGLKNKSRSQRGEEPQSDG